MNLFFSCISKNLIIILEKNKKIIDSFKETFYLDHVNNCVKSINSFLKKNNLNFFDLNNIYVTSKIGSLTGKRVCFTILKTLSILKPDLNFFEINSLIFQVGNNQGYSLIKTFKYKYYYSLIKNKQIIFEPKIIEDKNLNNLKLTKEKIFLDFDNCNYVQNFLDLKKDFKKIKNIKNYEI